MVRDETLPRFGQVPQGRSSTTESSKEREIRQRRYGEGKE